MNTLAKHGFAFFAWSKKNPIGTIPQSVAREGAGENRIPFTHFANSVPVYLTLKDILLKSPKKKAAVLDIGCGTGRNLSFIKDTLKKPGFQFFGIDYSIGCISYAKSQYKKMNITFIQHDGKIAPFPDESFDYIVSSHVLEHIPLKDAHIYISEISRILKKGGVAVIGTPNRAYCQDLFCKNPKEEEKYRLIIPHLHEFYYDEFKKLVGDKKLFHKTRIYQTTNAICRELMIQGANKIKPGKSILQTLIFEIYSVVRKSSILQDIMAKVGSELLIRRMNTSYKDLILSTTIGEKDADKGDNFIAVLTK